MGGCLSAATVAPPQILEHADGTDEEYQQRFVEDCILGEGQYGIVKLVHYAWPTGKEQASPPLACKMLHKGAYVRNNVSYSPLNPKLLRTEVNILQALAGDCFCLKLMAVYESPCALYVVTEYCSGGGMMEYMAARQQELRTEDVSRVAFQLLSAVHHCARNGVIHRDIKPDNSTLTVLAFAVVWCFLSLWKASTCVFFSKVLTFPMGSYVSRFISQLGIALD